MEENQQICIACNKMQSSFVYNCDCGHVMRESVILERERSRKRRAPYRPNSISSEWIGVNQLNGACMKQIKKCTGDIQDDNKVLLKSFTSIKQKQSCNKKRKFPVKQKKRIFEKTKHKKSQSKELLQISESSYQNIYFNRCKSYRKAKISDLDFEFDFSTFDSHSPFYPTALEDINTKINRTNTFYRLISE
ncbi:uncharacterized protein LOC130628519 [Hydractinia symbiolongicarpus]|uniref:uncharacterized protein LOC130628519 n=1 Tax=Hydractinia symbiolongicarpus TaxID=13093 RepID=UPI00254E2F84|nr:uncharacterized protein LOC130628519 [Hydractinia symbiolongicarpus]